uniref:Apple domain-containing protein n=1 Tax=Caenorhabditis japonica TaxID=281687 RepID=A0A8R1I230_CAEJA
MIFDTATRLFSLLLLFVPTVKGCREDTEKAAFFVHGEARLPQSADACFNSCALGNCTEAVHCLNAFKMIAWDAMEVRGESRIYNGSDGIEKCMERCQDCDFVLFNEIFSECYSVWYDPAGQVLDFVNDEYQVLTNACSNYRKDCNARNSLYVSYANPDEKLKAECLEKCTMSDNCHYVYQSNDLKSCVISRRRKALPLLVQRMCVDVGDFPDGSAVLFDELGGCQGEEGHLVGKDLELHQCMQLCATHPTRSCESISYTKSRTCYLHDKAVKPDERNSNCSIFTLNVITFQTEVSSTIPPGDSKPRKHHKAKTFSSGTKKDQKKIEESRRCHPPDPAPMESICLEITGIEPNSQNRILAIEKEEENRRLIQEAKKKEELAGQCAVMKSLKHGKIKRKEVQHRMMVNTNRERSPGGTDTALISPCVKRMSTSTAVKEETNSELDAEEFLDECFELSGEQCEEIVDGTLTEEDRCCSALLLSLEISDDSISPLPSLEQLLGRIPLASRVTQDIGVSRGAMLQSLNDVFALQKPPTPENLCVSEERNVLASAVRNAEKRKSGADNEEERVNATELWVMTNGKTFTSENLLSEKISRTPIAEKDDLMREATSSYSVMSGMYEGPSRPSRDCDEDCDSCYEHTGQGQLHVEIAMDTD